MIPISKLLDAKNPEEVKLWADKIYKYLTDIGSGGSNPAVTIKSIQRGTISITGTNTSQTATITAVDPAKTELRVLGVTHNTSLFLHLPYLVLTNATTITATRMSAANGTSTISWELTEHE